MRREVGAAGRSAPLIRECLLARLAGPLPGASAHRSVWPERLGRRVTLHDAAGYADASVLIALHHTANGIRFPLIKRPEAMRKHPGQVALPGGRCEAGESGSSERQGPPGGGAGPAPLGLFDKVRAFTGAAEVRALLAASWGAA